MKRLWPAYVGVTLLGGLVGAAIAGVPESGQAGVIDVPVLTEPPATLPPATLPATTTTLPAAATTTTTTTMATTTTVASTTTTLPVTTTTVVELLDRAELFVVAVNGANVTGLAGRTAELLNELGYEQTRPTDGAFVSEMTLIYFEDGLSAEAERLAADLGLVQPQLLPIDDAAPFNVLDGDQLAVYVGLDRV